MDNYIYWDSALNTIPAIEDVPVYSAGWWQTGIRFIDSALRYSYPALRFPQKTTDYKAQRVQRMNYDHFINTMAEMVKKYAPKMLN